MKELRTTRAEEQERHHGKTHHPLHQEYLT